MLSGVVSSIFLIGSSMYDDEVYYEAIYTTVIEQMKEGINYIINSKLIDRNSWKRNALNGVRKIFNLLLLFFQSLFIKLCDVHT